MKNSSLLFSVFAASLWLAASAHSQPCSLDLSFNPTLNTGAVVYAVALQPNGQILIGGAFNSIGNVTVSNVARLNPDGTLDPTFNPGSAADVGYVDTIAVQKDGKVLAGGSFYSSSAAAPANLARLNSDGTVDHSFDTNLYIDGPVNAVLVQSDDKILFGGGFVIVDFYLRRSVARLNSDGTLDTTFDACVASSAGSGATALALLSDGKILAGGNFTFSNGMYRDGIARLGSCGDLDPLYAAPPGVNAGAVVYTIALRSDEQVLLGGNFQSYRGFLRRGIVRLTTSGAVDSSFDPGTGIDNGTTIYTIALQNDGKAIIGGTFNSYNGQTKHGVARINGDGSLDNICDSASGPDDAVGSFAIQTDGRILVAGKFASFNGVARNGLARVNGDHLPFRLGPPNRLVSGQFQLTLFGENQARYAIEASSNLVHWVSLTNFTANGAASLFVDPDVEFHSSRFYRAVLP